MTWIDKHYINDFLNKKDFDIRKSHNGRWIDQKCTPDVVTIIADCILNYVEEQDSDDVFFTSLDIWHSDYARNNVNDIFRKPDTELSKARNEYDKYFQQPMKMLSYAGVLEEQKQGRNNFFKVLDKDLIQYLSLRERNSLDFLSLYIEKVLRDSDIFYLFEQFFNSPNKSSFHHMKSGFEYFTINNTPINGELECRRIFTKVLNPLSFVRRKQGTKKGQLSEFAITYDMLMYNQENFRDIYANKPKDMTRKQFDEVNHIVHRENREYYRYLSQRAKNAVRQYNDLFNNKLSEIPGSSHEIANQIHHIFPEADFPTICYFVENLIALQPNQHFNQAHPNNNTQIISTAYQQTCLLAKVETIKIDYREKRDFYDFNKFIEVLSVGLSKESFRDIANLDFDSVIHEINVTYANMPYIF